MKRLLCSLFCCVGLFALIASASAQMQKPKTPPLSPPAKAEGTIGGKSISIAYSSPRVKGRVGKLFTSDGRISKDPHYPVWRAGANAATTLVLGGDVKIGDVDVPAGTYTLFADISNPDNWTLIISKDTGEWGLSYDSTKDLGRTPMKMSVPPSTIEDLKWSITNHGHGHGVITLAWENHVASVPVDAK
jgi:hypothetical protein